MFSATYLTFAFCANIFPHVRWSNIKSVQEVITDLCTLI